MRILHVLLTRMPLPPPKYGGTERVLWALYKGQKALGHEVKFLTKYRNNHPDAILYNPNVPIEKQIEGWADIIHFHFLYDKQINTPYVCTTHNQHLQPFTFPLNTIFLGKLHAERSGGSAYVYNGLYWEDYGKPNLNTPKNYIHFLANAKYRDKNLRDSIEIARKSNKPLQILGSKRFCLKWRADGKYQPYYYFGSDLTFHGMVGGEEKNQIIRNSQALLFPVLNYEAFGLAMIESLYLGCPVIGSRYGSVPELITPEIGLSTNSKSKMIDALKNLGQFNRKACHEYAQEMFNHLAMSKKYVAYYEKVAGGGRLHEKPPTIQNPLPTNFKLDP